MTDLNEKTTINLWGIMSALPVLVGLIFWLTVLWARAETNLAKIQKIEADNKEFGAIISDIHDRVIRIEEKLNHSHGGKK